MSEVVLYRVLSDRLRVQRGPGNADLVVERPVKVMNPGKANERKVYADSAEAPTLINFDELCQVNIPQLLKFGAIEVYDGPPLDWTMGHPDGGRVEAAASEKKTPRVRKRTG